MKTGWRGESYRHYLAAKGIKTTNKTRFYAKNDSMQLDLNVLDLPETSQPVWAKEYNSRAQKSNQRYYPESVTRPVDPFRSAVKESALSALEEREVRSKRRFEQALQNAQSGSPDAAIRMLQDPANPAWAGELTIEHKDSRGRTKVEVDQLKVSALKAALNARALQLAQAGIPIDPALQKVVDSSVLSRAETIQKYRDEAQRREFESPLRKELRERIIPAAEAGAISAAPETIFAGGKAFFGQKSADSLEDFDSLGKRAKSSAFIKDNAVVGWEEQAQPSVFDDIEGTRLRSSWDFIPETRGGVNLVTNPPRKTRSDVVQDRVDSIFDQKGDFAKADLSAFEKGQKAFKEGDRESLINNVLELQREEAKLQNRNKFIDQAMADLNSKENYANSFSDGGSGNFLFGGSKGADKLNDQIKKIHEVKGEVAKKHNEVFTRRRLLQQDLVRLDSQMPPITDIPNVAPRTLSDKSSSWDSSNPTIKLFKDSNPFKPS